MHTSGINTDTFHRDEREAQRRAGFDGVTGAIRPFMPGQHREFFALLPWLIVATLDDTGWPVATMLTGPPGFVHTPDATTLRIDTTRHKSTRRLLGWLPDGISVFWASISRPDAQSRQRLDRVAGCNGVHRRGPAEFR